MKNKGIIVHIAGVIAMIIWGLSFIWSSQTYKSLNPTATIFLRLVIATAFFSAILFSFRLNEKIRREHLKLFAIAALFEPFLYFIFEGYGLIYTSPIISSAIIAMIPLVTPVAAAIFLKERLSAMNIVGLVVSFTGVIVMLLNKDMEFSASPLGIMFLFLTVLVAVGYSIALIKLTHLYKPMTVTWMQNIIGMIYFIPLVFIMEKFMPSDFGNVRAYIVPLVCLGIFCSAIAYALWAYAYSKLGASKANVYTNLIPVFTAIFSYIILIFNRDNMDISDIEAYELNVQKIAGIALVVGGLFLSQKKSRKDDNKQD